ncbi:hypothetical protein IEQ34_010616 [Dendrobium chrysotoxum]|uniref:Uncharacterized protein n=1 Tax=Dendrobium chrysotoxum TaxID=161865 RepID=A0AAV7GW57_DENCH|nr:hypothetical protein IEQ34_010616 [Dendrobium chrysotoxum]
MQFDAEFTSLMRNTSQLRNKTILPNEFFHIFFQNKWDMSRLSPCPINFPRVPQDSPNDPSPFRLQPHPNVLPGAFDCFL